MLHCNLSSGLYFVVFMVVASNTAIPGSAFASNLGPRKVRVASSLNNFTYMPVYDIPSHFTANDQHYDLTYSGLAEFCASQPAGCADASQQEQLKMLQVRYFGGWSAIIAGAATFCGIAATVLFQSDSAAPRDFKRVAIGGAVGLPLAVVGAVVLPSRVDFLRFINTTKSANPDVPIHVLMGRADNEFRRPVALR